MGSDPIFFPFFMRGSPTRGPPYMKSVMVSVAIRPALMADPTRRYLDISNLLW